MTTVAHTDPTVQFDTALRTMAARATERYAGEAARLDKGLTIALNHGVTFLPDGTALVQSQREAEIVYEVKDGRCDCPDATRAPEFRCKHRWAACLTTKATKAVAAAQGRAEQAYYTTTTDTQGLVLGGHRATADTKRAEEEAAGGLAAIICGYGKGQ